MFTKNTIFSKHVSDSIRNDSCPMTVSEIQLLYTKGIRTVKWLR